MDFVELPNQDPELTGTPEDVLRDIAEEGINNLFFLCSGILGMKDLTRRCHQPYCNFIESNPAKIKLSLMPRGHLKTSVGTVGGTIQRVLKDWNRTNLIVNESSGNSEAMLREIRSHAESNRRFRTLYGKYIPKDTRSVRWNDHQLDFERDRIDRMPTIASGGMTGALTSQHYNHITFDDPISEEAAGSEKIMKDAIGRLRAQQALLVKPEEDTILYNGTRWTFADVYAWVVKVFPLRIAKFIRSVIEEDQILWPERFTPEILAEMREAMGEYKWSCLMMNNPRNETVQDFNVRDIRWWRWYDSNETKIDLLNRDQNVIDSWEISDLDITVALDPAPAEFTDSDRNAIVVTGITPRAQCVVLETWAERCTPQAVLAKLSEVKRRWDPRVFGIEGVAYQKTFKYFLKQHGLDRGEYFNIDELRSQNKNHKVRQIRSLQPIAAGGRLYLYPTQHILRDELSDFPMGEHDDVADALAMNTQLWLGRVSPEQLERSRKVRDRLLGSIQDDGTVRGEPRIKNDMQLASMIRGTIVIDEEDFDEEDRITVGNIQEWSMPGGIR